MAKSSKTKPKRRGRTARKVKRRVQHFIWGDLISSRMLGKYKFLVIGVMALIIVYITIKYECQTRMETIHILNDELQIARSESIRYQSAYRSRTRESMMQQMVDSMHLGLHIQQQPPYILEYDEE